MKILVDLSHITEKGFWDVARLSKAPLVATHSNAHALCASPRNLTDRQLAAIRDSGGMVGLNFATCFLRPDGNMIAPYLSIAWRMTGDPRWAWLEGDERLIGIYDLGDQLGDLAPFAERLRTLHITTHQPLEQSVRGGTQTDGELFSRIEPEIRTLRRVIVEAVERHVAQLPPPDPRHPVLRHNKQALVRFSGSWSVRLAGSGYHSKHIHPEGWYSSAFYVVLPEGTGGPNHDGWLALGGSEASLGIDLPPARLIEPKPGRLVLFPSTMWHGTVPFQSGERLTVAFDVATPQ
jgi:hypothetical protein